MRATQARVGIVGVLGLLGLAVSAVPTIDRASGELIPPLNVTWEAADPSAGVGDVIAWREAEDAEAARVRVYLEGVRDARIAQEAADARRARDAAARANRGARRTVAPTAEPAAEGGGEWTTSLASFYGPGLYGNHVACAGEPRLTPSTIGVAHRTLPCGTVVEFRVGDRTARARVIDRGPHVAGRTWDLTAALRDQLGARDLGPVEWRLA